MIRCDAKYNILRGESSWVNDGWFFCEVEHTSTK